MELYINNNIQLYKYIAIDQGRLLNKFLVFTESKEQVLANLANFAYDPVNYDYLRRLRVIDLFLHGLSENNTTLLTFAVKGICNVCLGKLH